MASKLDNILGIFKQTKSRTIFLVTMGIILLGLFFAVSGLRRSGIASDGGDGQANLPNAPRISGAPDILNSNTVSAQRAKLNTQADNQAVWQAASQGKSALPTSFGKPVSLNGQDINEYNQENQARQTLNNIVNTADTDNTGNTADRPTSDPRQSMQEADAQADAQSARLQSRISSEDGGDDGVGGDISGAMATEVKQLLASWNPTPQQYTESPAQQTGSDNNGSSTSQAGTTGQSSLTGGGSGRASAAGTPPLLKAGTILFGVLQTSVNTDSPGPIMATVELGPYKGAKLLGSLQPAGKYAKGVALKFTTMTLPQYKTSIGINAYAIDPDTAHTALASNVDHHYLLRYGTLIASSFLGGLGEATALSNSTIVNGPLGSSSQNYQLPNNFGAQALYAGGTVGQKLGDELGDVYNRPTTITINSGTGIGILYMADVSPPSQNTPLASRSIPSLSPTEQTQTTLR